MSFNRNTGLYEGFIYLVSNNINNKKYIGQTKRTVEERWSDHLSKLQSDVNYFHNAILKHGKEHFYIETIDIVTAKDPDTLNEILNKGEIYYIAKYNTVHPNGYNLTNGGGNTSFTILKPVCQYDFEGNYIATYESINSASEQLGINRKGIGNCCNRNVSRNGKKSYSAGGYIWRFEGDTDIKDSLEYLKKRYRKIVKYDLEGNVLAIFNNLQEAALDLGNIKCINNISQCCNEQCYTYKGYQYSFEGSLPRKNKQKREVIQYSLDGTFIHKYSSLTSAGEAVGTRGQNIGTCCLRKTHTCQGYIWRYAEDALTEQDIYKANNPIRHGTAVSQYDLNGNFIATYKSLKDATKSTGAYDSNIKNCCDGILKQTNGFIWKYADDPITQEDVDVFNQPHFNSKQLNRYTLDGKYIDTFESVAYLYREFGYSQGNISMCCRGVRNKAYGYKWYYANDPNQPDKTKIMKEEDA